MTGKKHAAADLACILVSAGLIFAATVIAAVRVEPWGYLLTVLAVVAGWVLAVLGISRRYG